MASSVLFVLSIARAMTEVAGYALLGQWVVAILAGRSRNENVVYRLLQTVSSPAARLVRAITPRVVVDRRIPVITFFILFWLWIGLAAARRYFCVMQGLDCMQ